MGSLGVDLAPDGGQEGKRECGGEQDWRRFSPGADFALLSDIVLTVSNKARRCGVF